MRSILQFKNDLGLLCTGSVHGPQSTVRILGDRTPYQRFMEGAHSRPFCRPLTSFAIACPTLRARSLNPRELHIQTIPSVNAASRPVTGKVTTAASVVHTRRVRLPRFLCYSSHSVALCSSRPTPSTPVRTNNRIECDTFVADCNTLLLRLCRDTRRGDAHQT